MITSHGSTGKLTDLPQCSHKSILCASAGTIRPIPCVWLMFFNKIKTRLFPTWLLFLDLYSWPPMTAENKFCSHLSARLNSASLLGISVPTFLPHTVAHLSCPRPGIPSSAWSFWTLLCHVMSCIFFCLTATTRLYLFIHLHSLFLLAEDQTPSRSQYMFVEWENSLSLINCT